jgi:hypothetical protein
VYKNGGAADCVTPLAGVVYSIGPFAKRGKCLKKGLMLMLIANASKNTKMSKR